MEGSSKTLKGKGKKKRGKKAAASSLGEELRVVVINTDEGKEAADRSGHVTGSEAGSDLDEVLTGIQLIKRPLSRAEERKMEIERKRAEKRELERQRKLAEEEGKRLKVSGVKVRVTELVQFRPKSTSELTQI